MVHIMGTTSGLLGFWEVAVMVFLLCGSAFFSERAQAVKARRRAFNSAEESAGMSSFRKHDSKRLIFCGGQCFYSANQRRDWPDSGGDFGRNDLYDFSFVR
jgi:hypothetical protein